MSAATGMRGVVAVGASAGGVEALRAFVAGLPADLAAAVVVVLHIPRTAPSALSAILDRAGTLPARAATELLPLCPGQVYVAPADRHVLVALGHLRLTDAPAEQGHRPAIDPLLRSAGDSYGPNAVGIVLSGTGDDGAAGLAALVARGGIALVQDPGEAAYPAMPRHALARVPSATPCSAGELGVVLARLLAERAPTG